MRKCIIHIGMHKTGSSSIQASLRSLSDGRFTYAQIGESPNHSLQMFSLFSTNPGRHHLHRVVGRDAEQLNSYVEKVRIDLDRSVSNANDRALIISAEDVSVFDLEASKRLERYLTGHFDDVRIVGYVRPPAAFIASGFQQRVKSGAVHAFNLPKIYRNYRKTFWKFDEIFGRSNVQLWKFDPRSFPEGCVVRDFCSRLGISIEATSIVRRNESLPREIVSLLYGYNKYCATQRIELLSPQESKRFQRLFAGTGNTKFHLSPDLIRPILEMNRADIGWMEERLGESLEENLNDSQPGDVRDEQDLLKPDSAVVTRMRELLGGAAPAGLKGETALEAAVLLNTLRGEVPLMGTGDARTGVVRDERRIGMNRNAKLKFRESPNRGNGLLMHNAPQSLANDEYLVAGGLREAAGADSALLDIGKNTQDVGEFESEVGPITLRSRPLVNRDKKLIVIWSPKSACTTIYVWFSLISGFLDEVRSFHRFPHRHRTQVFYRSELYRRSIASDLADCHVLRIIRDPYHRAVSIYRHALITGFAERVISKSSEGRLNGVSGYSFQQFLDIVSILNMEICNPHFRPQFHPYERTRQADTIINISKQDMFQELNSFETGAGLPRTDFASMTWLHTLEGRRSAKATKMAGDSLDETALTEVMVRHLRQFPTYDQLLTPAAKAKIEEIYRVDFDAYREYL